MIERINVFYKGLGSEDPGGAGSFAYLIFHDAELIHEASRFLPPEAKLSRFVAEYRALMEITQWLIDQGKHPHHIRFHGDEPIIVNHMNRRWKPKADLFPLVRQTQFLMAGLKDAHFNWVPIDKNVAVKPAMDVMIKNGIDPKPYLEAQEKVNQEKIANGEYR